MVPRKFTSFLDIIEPFLKRNTYNYVRYDGSMKPEQREANLEALRSDPATSVILISFKAGSTGLNLTCCNHVVLCDLWCVAACIAKGTEDADGPLLDTGGTRRSRVSSCHSRACRP
jgi:hypothetical protein